MAQIVLLGLVIVACLRGLVQWRDGLLGVVLLAAVQDPLRKLVPGAPGYLVLAAAPVLVMSLFGLAHASPAWWRGFQRRFPAIKRAMGWFALACLPAAVISATYGPGSWMLTLFGVFSYSVILAAVLLGYNFPRSSLDLRRFLGFYCVVTSVMLSGATVQYFDLLPGSLMVGTEALGTTWIRHVPGYQYQLLAGFYRSPDVMGWHAATTAMFASILALTHRGRGRWLWSVLTVLAVVALVLCGRRKMVFMLPAFVGAVMWMYWKTRTASNLPAVVGIGAVVLLGAVGFSSDGDEPSLGVVRYYTENQGDVLDRLQKHGLDAVMTTFNQAGFLGSGLGVASPGSHHLAVARPRKVWQEGTASRFMVELGVPGLLALLFLVGSIVAAGWKVTMRRLRARAPDSGYAAGLFGFFVANAASLVVSGQILADPAIATLIGLSIGLVLAQERLVSAPATRTWGTRVVPAGSVRPAVRPARETPFVPHYANVGTRIPSASAGH